MALARIVDKARTGMCYLPIARHGLIGDPHIAALVAGDGRVVRKERPAPGTGEHTNLPRK
jgi:hypothetical protein